MAKQDDIIQKLAQTQEERLLLARVLEKADICRERCYPTYTRFLDLHEAELARRLLEAVGENGRFWGGYDGAERTILAFLPDWMEEIPQEGEDCPLAAIRCLRHKSD